MASVVKIKRSSVQGKAPNNSILETGELAFNLRDQKLFSSNGTVVFEVGSNVSSIDTSSIHFSNTGIISSNDDLTILLDTNNNDSSASLTVKKNTPVKAGGSELFKVSESGVITINNSYSLPNNDGSQGQALVSDGSGTVTFGNVVTSDEIDEILERNNQITANVVFNGDTTSNNLFVEGDLVVRGNVTTVSSEELNVDTNFINLNANLIPTIGPLLDAGIEINRGSSANTKFFWDESLNRWKFTYGENAQKDVKIPVTLDDVLENGFASNNNITVNGTSRFKNAKIETLEINSEYELPGSYGAAGFVLASHGNGSLYWIASNNELRTSTEFTSYKFTANTGQTLFNGNDDNNTLLRYEIGRQNVFLNGVRLTNGTDYSATSGTTVVFSEPVNDNDIITIDSYGYTDNLQVGNNVLISTSELKSTSVLQTTLDTFSETDFVSAQYFVSAANSSAVHTTTVNLAHVSGTAYITEYGTVQTGPSLMSLDADVNGGLVRLLATPTGIDIDIKVHRTTFRA